MGCTSLRKPPKDNTVYPQQGPIQTAAAPTVTTYQHHQASYNFGPSQMEASAVQPHSIYKESITNNQIRVTTPMSAQYVQPRPPSYSPTIQPPPTYTQQSIYTSTKVQTRPLSFGGNTQYRQFVMPCGPSTQEYYERRHRRM